MNLASHRQSAGDDVSAASQPHLDDAPHARNLRPPMRWRESLHVKMTLCQLGLLVLLIGVTVAIMFTVQRSLLIREGQNLAEQLGNRVVSDVETRIALTESLTTALANLGERLGSDTEAYMKIVPHILDYEGNETFIAGGGIWPEPNALIPGVERSSFFWGREPDGTLKYYDDYNDPEGSGYHHEEWYVPATYYPPGKAFWSKSYMDPYSYQPMVTCTVPMRNNGRVIGVATVDLNLQGLHEFLQEASQVLGGYLFVVDRNNKFLTFPDQEMVKRHYIDDKGKPAVEFLYASDLTERNASFGCVADALSRLNRRILDEADLTTPRPPSLFAKSSSAVIRLTTTRHVW